MKFKTIVEHWRYEDGWRPIPSILQKDGIDKEYIEGLVGWHCWVYPGDEHAFSEWMKTNMKYNCEYEYKFNSGDPMIMVHIKDAQDATLFKLTWM